MGQTESLVLLQQRLAVQRLGCVVLVWDGILIERSHEELATPGRDDNEAIWKYCKILSIWWFGTAYGLESEPLNSKAHYSLE